MRFGITARSFVQATRFCQVRISSGLRSDAVETINSEVYDDSFNSEIGDL